MGGTADTTDNATTSRNERGSEGRCSDPPEEPDPGLDVQRSSLERPAGRKGLALGDKEEATWAVGAGSAVEVGKVGEGLAMASAWAVGAGSALEVGEMGGGRTPGGGGETKRAIETSAVRPACPLNQPHRFDFIHVSGGGNCLTKQRLGRSAAEV